jgi:hypothetical protein
MAGFALAPTPDSCALAAGAADLAARPLPKEEDRCRTSRTKNAREPQRGTSLQGLISTPALLPDPDVAASRWSTTADARLDAATITAAMSAVTQFGSSGRTNHHKSAAVELRRAANPEKDRTMRNLAQYPITLDEAIRAVERAVQDYDSVLQTLQPQEIPIGSIHGAALKDAASRLRRMGFATWDGKRR